MILKAELICWLACNMNHVFLVESHWSKKMWSCLWDTVEHMRCQPSISTYS